MNKLMLGTLLLGSLALGACGGADAPDTSGDSGSAPAPTPHNLGRIRLNVDGLGTPTPTATAENLDAPAPATAGVPRAHLLGELFCFIQIQPTPVSSSAFNVGSTQYVSFTFLVRNAQGVNDYSCGTGVADATNTNVTLLGLVEPSLGIGGTPFISLKEFDGSNAPAGIATSILPSHGMVFDPLTNSAKIQAGAESLQVFTEAQIAGLHIDPEDEANSYLVPYGFVIRNVDPSKGRTLPSNPPQNQYDGEFTFAVEVPVPASKKTAVYSFQYDLEAVTDTQTRVTESLEEQTPLGDFEANLRAIALGSTDVAVAGGYHVAATNFGDPICKVRSAGPTIDPEAVFYDNSDGLGLAAAPYGVAGIPPLGPLRAAFCQPLLLSPTQGGIYDEFVVNGSETGRRNLTGYYSGSYGGSQTQQITFTPNHPFRLGEQVMFTLGNLQSALSGHTSPPTWVGLAQIAGSAPGSTGAFTVHGSTGVGSDGDIVVGDFNNDGKLDFATVNSGNGTVAIELGNGTGGFSAASGSPYSVPFSYPSGIVMGDFNDDGKQDLVVVGNNGPGNTSRYAVLLGTGSGAFAVNPPQPLTGAAAVSGALHAVTGDFNGDGQPDIAIANFQGVSLAVLYGYGTGGFTTGPVLSLEESSTYMTVADFDGDGKLDLALPEAYLGRIQIYPGDGLGNFSEYGSVLTAPDPNVFASCAGDFNSDGTTDLIGGSDGHLWFHAGKGDGNFGPAVTFANVAGYSLVCRDFNGDGKLDVAAADRYNNIVRIFLGEGNGQFLQGSVIPMGFPWMLASGDFMQSGKIDLLASSSAAVTLLAGQ
jgi:hypothetical protein